MNSPVSAPITPPVRSQEGRQAPSTPMKQSVQCTRRVHARLEREAQMAAQSQRGVRGTAKERGEAAAGLEVGPRTDCLDELVEHEGFDRDLLSRSIYTCWPETAKGPGLARTWLSAMLKRKCLLTANAADVQETTRNVAASHEGRQAPNRMRELRRECLTDMRRSAAATFPLAQCQHLLVGCQRSASSRVEDATTASWFLRESAAPPDFWQHRAQGGFLLATVTGLCL